MFIWSLTYQQSVFKRYCNFSDFLPARRRPKSTGIDVEQNYITVTLCISDIRFLHEVTRTAYIGQRRWKIDIAVRVGVWPCYREWETCTRTTSSCEISSHTVCVSCRPSTLARSRDTDRSHCFSSPTPASTGRSQAARYIRSAGYYE